MNREMQSKLVAVLRDTMNAQGITQSDVARHIGTSSGMVSQAFSCKGQMREERWRMCCEFCGVDFDRFMGTPQSACADSSPTKGSLEETVGATIGQPVPAEQTEPVHEEEVQTMSSNPKAVAELNRAECDMLVEFIELTLPIAATHLVTTVTYKWLDSMIKMHDYLKDSADIVD